MNRALTFVIAAMVSAAGCQTSTHDGHEQAASLFGQPLYPPPIPPDTYEKLRADLSAARAAYDANPSEENAIWLGRRLAYLGRFREAIEIYTINITRYPNSYKLLRHRGHRYITVREFNLAIADLTRASALIANIPDEIEPDGAPNAANIPRSTSHSNIWYHLALAHYLKGDFASAADCWRECLKFSTNDDMKVATANWLYVALRRAGKPDEAAQVLNTVSPGMEILENKAYFELLNLYKHPETAYSNKTFARILIGESAENSAGAIDDATLGYGVGNWQLIRGNMLNAKLVFEKVTASPNWAPFGFIAAEAELARLASHDEHSK